MNDNNLDYLKKLLFHLGFNEKLNDVLETAIRRELPRFTLGITNTHRPLEITDQKAPRTDYVQYELNFNKGKDNDTYFLNNYMVILHKTGESVPRIQTFDLERDHRITAMQAYKLLSGQSFEKDVYLKPKEEGQTSEKIPMWFKLNLDITDAYGNHPMRKMRPEYGYQLENALAKYPFTGLEAGTKKADALKALRNGNYFASELIVGKKQVPVLIAANPQMKSIDIYDKKMKEIRDEDIWPEKAVVKTSTQHYTPEPANTEQDSRSWEQEEEQEQGVSIGR